jgi:hypothetical protein
LLLVLPEYSTPSTNLDAFGFIQQHPFEFADGTFSRLGAAYTVAGSQTQGRLSVFVYSPDDVYEYFFKDSTGNRTFRFYVDTPLMEDFLLPKNAMAGCVFLPGQPCGGAEFSLDFAGNDDVVSFANRGLDGAYFFPRLAFSQEGIHYTSGGLTSAVLRVQRVRRSDIRNDPPGPLPGPLDPSPDADPEPVPEPSTWAMVGLAGVWGMWMRRRAKGSGRRR